MKIRDFLDKKEKERGLYFNYLHPLTGKWGQRKSETLKILPTNLHISKPPALTFSSNFYST